MSQKIPTPSEAAAANQEKRNKEQSEQRLVTLAAEAIGTYTGEGCVEFDVPADLPAALDPDALSAKLPGWALYVHAGKVYLGTAEQVALVIEANKPKRPPEPKPSTPPPYTAPVQELAQVVPTPAAPTSRTFDVLANCQRGNRQLHVLAGENLQGPIHPGAAAFVRIKN